MKKSSNIRKTVQKSKKKFKKYKSQKTVQKLKKHCFFILFLNFNNDGVLVRYSTDGTV